MNSQKNFFQVMLCLWVAAVICMGIGLVCSTQLPNNGSVLTFLFTSGIEKKERLNLPSVNAPLPVQKPEIKPNVPEIPEWTAVSTGKKAGSGILGKPEITQKDDGTVEIIFQVEGNLGNINTFKPGKITAFSLDLMGKWEKYNYFDHKLSGGCLSRIQIAQHAQWIRISGISAKGITNLTAKADFSAKRNTLRIIFSADK